MLISRLLKMKELSSDLEPVVPRSESLNPVAVDLGLTNKEPGFFSNQSRHLPKRTDTRNF
jgi:hypothetical protein